MDVDFRGYLFVNKIASCMDLTDSYICLDGHLVKRGHLHGSVE